MMRWVCDGSWCRDEGAREEEQEVKVTSSV